MAAPDPSENEAVQLRKLAQDMAAARRESVTTAHLLAAIAARSGPAADLLADRKLDVDMLTKLARASSDDIKDPIGRAMRHATDVARSCGSREPSAVHLLIALLKDRHFGALRALEQAGIDVARLRLAATQIARGLVSPRRPLTRGVDAQATTSSCSNSIAQEPRMAHKPAAAVVVPLFPPAARPSRPPPPPDSAPAAAPAAAAVVEPRSRTAGRRRPPPITQQQLEIQPEHRFELDSKTMPVLAATGINLVLAAVRGELDPVVGRDTEMEQILDVLAKRRANNACLVGRPGVGKTSVVRGLAQRIAASNSPRPFEDKVLVELPIAQLLAGTGVRGALSERLAAICKEVRQAGRRVVIVLDDAAQLFASDTTGEAVGELKLALSRGELPMIATMSIDDYRRTIDADPALEHCFTPVEIEEPDADQAVEMIAGATKMLEQHHGLIIEPEAADASVRWSVRYLPGRALPEKAFAVLDLASARSRRRGRSSTQIDCVAEVIGEMAGMPPERLLESDRDRMLALESLLAQRVVGHGEAIARIATILRRNAAGLRGQRPIGSFLLLGPTGVGKTETAKAIAEALFQSPDAMTRLDLSEFSEPHAVARLIGAPPGYVGHEAGGQLTESVRRRPYQVLLLDEFEKAHRDVLQAFLQVLDEGRMTDGRGRTVDFTNTVIVLTSNLGAMEAKQAAETRTIGFARNDGATSQAMEQAVVGAARAALPPELYNRIDEVLFFHPLTRADVREVARRLLAQLANKLLEARGIGLEFNDDGVEALLDQGGYDPSLGARPMKRAIARLVEAPIAEMVLRDEALPGDIVRVRGGPRHSLELFVVPNERRRPRS
jgi:ATP-dependent Clp protease ATP-binding subunit ClpC